MTVSREIKQQILANRENRQYCNFAVGIYLTREQHRQFKLLSKMCGSTMSRMVAEMIQDRLDKATK